MGEVQAIIDAAVKPIREQIEKLEKELKEAGPERQKAASAKAEQLRCETHHKTYRFVIGAVLALAVLHNHGDTLRHIFRPPPVDIAARVDALVGDALPERRIEHASHLDECAAALKSAAEYVNKRAMQSAGSTPTTSELRKRVERRCQSLLVR